jgi:Flp pilus assembly pilin Flp
MHDTMNGLIAALIRRITTEKGQALAEYALVLAFIAAVCVIAVTALGLAISGTLEGVTGSF